MGRRRRLGRIDDQGAAAGGGREGEGRGEVVALQGDLGGVGPLGDRQHAGGRRAGVGAGGGPGEGDVQQIERGLCRSGKSR